MKPLIPYLFFNGNCREAMNFYKACFGGDLQLMTYADAPDDVFPKDMKLYKDRIMHAILKEGELSLMASDMPDDEEAKGNNVQISIECDSIPEIEKLFKLLSDGGEVKNPLEDAFWGARFGMLTDKFGMNWMLNCVLQK